MITIADVKTIEDIVKDISKLIGKEPWLVGAGIGGSKDKPKLVLAVRHLEQHIKSLAVSTVKSSYGTLEDGDIEVIEVGEIEVLPFFRGDKGKPYG